MGKFALTCPFKPAGGQPEAIYKLSSAILNNNKYQTLLGVTGSGKTFSMAAIIAKVNKPCLIISPNKTLAAQLYTEFKEFFPKNAVEYFISYYDYYQPEAYIPHTDTYIEKDASINKKIDRLRLAASTALMTRNDVIVVASVSCIYNLGSPLEYRNMFFNLSVGQNIGRDEFLKHLLFVRYERNDIDFAQGNFRVRGDTIEIFPPYARTIIRVEFFGNQVEALSLRTPLTLKKEQDVPEIVIYPAKHFLANSESIKSAIVTIKQELKLRLKDLNKQGKLLEAQRLKMRTNFDLEMLKEVGFCHGIENYSRHISARPQGSRPYSLIDYFSKNFLVIIDESHITVPQIRGMYNGDRARKETLVKYGFRLPSCLDNRPLKFSEFEELAPQVLFVSATAGVYELEKSAVVVEQIIRPTGLVDPEIIIVPVENQINDLIYRIKMRAKRNERVLITTLTKRMAEDLSRYLQKAGIAAQYLHSELNSIERVKVLLDLRKKRFDCLVGINLLREGLDLPEVSLVCVLDADKEGFLRSATSLIQVIGRAARNINGRVVMYADNLTKSIKKAVSETNRRRNIQLAYNQKHKITPASIKKAVKTWIDLEEEAEEFTHNIVAEDLEAYAHLENIKELEQKMLASAKNLQFERAIFFREKINKLKNADKNFRD
ncbi:MAG: excinuclease ABC subunit B [Candidatus Omnitrophota bacterium]|nr:MAG: excinuclease ABC subunit B [Candidatus Omnitrophota bacterium]